MNKKSIFETSERSVTNGLPIEMDIFNFMRHLAESNPTLVLTRTSVKNSIVEEFHIEPEIAEAVGTDALYAIRKTTTPFLKRVGFGEYQHISGPGSPYVKTASHGPRIKVSPKAVSEAVVSVRILKDLGWEPERIIDELHQWPTHVVEAAIRKVFINFV